MDESTLHQLLLDLGETADAVADRLRELGVKGTPYIYCACPIAQLMERNGFPRPGFTPTYSRQGSWTATFAPADDVREVVVPEPVAEFARRFDRNEYPDLIEEAADA